jgi:hypothetical protein
MSSLEEGLGRVILGPVLGTIMLHLALGLELRSHHHRTGTLARVTNELRERLLSRLGLADDERDALQRTRDRAAFRAAQLSLPHRRRWSREARLQRALMAANVADDPRMRHKMLARLAVLRHAHELTTHDQSSPWLNDDAAEADGDDQSHPDAAAIDLREEHAQRAATVRSRRRLRKSDDEVQKVLALSDSGERVEHIADVTKMHPSTVRRILGTDRGSTPAQSPASVAPAVANNGHPPHTAHPERI